MSEMPPLWRACVTALLTVAVVAAARPPGGRLPDLASGSDRGGPPLRENHPELRSRAATRAAPGPDYPYVSRYQRWVQSRSAAPVAAVRRKPDETEHASR